MKVPLKEQIVLDQPSVTDRRVIRGLGVSDGVVIGRAFILDRRYVHVSREKLADNQIESEITALHKALEDSIGQLRLLKRQAGYGPT